MLAKARMPCVAVTAHGCTRYGMGKREDVQLVEQAMRVLRHGLPASLT